MVCDSWIGNVEVDVYLGAKRFQLSNLRIIFRFM